MKKVVDCRDSIVNSITSIPPGPPHLSIYTMQASPSNERNILRKLERAMPRHQPLELRALGTAMFTDYATHQDDVLVAKVRRTDELFSVHLHVANMMQDYVEETGFPQLTPSQQQMVAEYGSPYAGFLYRPHVTIARVRERPDIDIEGSWTSGEIVLARKDDTGWWENIGIYNLGKQF
jgi:2'-5' RNA ligase